MRERIVSGFPATLQDVNDASGEKRWPKKKGGLKGTCPRLRIIRHLFRCLRRDIKVVQISHLLPHIRCVKVHAAYEGNKPAHDEGIRPARRRILPSRRGADRRKLLGRKLLLMFTEHDALLVCH